MLFTYLCQTVAFLFSNIGIFFTTEITENKREEQGENDIAKASQKF